MPTSSQPAMDWLQAHATRATLDGMARYGIPPDHALGVTMADMKRLGKQLGATRQGSDRRAFDSGPHAHRAIATDKRNFVRKSVAMALKAIGKRNAPLREAALQVGGRLAASLDATAQWIGKDAVLIASPEYAHGVTGVIKDTLDWLVSFSPFGGKPVALFNASPRSTHWSATAGRSQQRAMLLL